MERGRHIRNPCSGSHLGLEPSADLCHAAERDFSEEPLLVAEVLVGRLLRYCSRRSGLYYLIAFAAIASSAGNPLINIAFTVAVALGWAWITAVYV